jgi:signal transduction histidine kinase
MKLAILFHSFRVRLLVLLAALLVLTLGVQYYVNVRAVRSNAQLIAEQQQAVMAGLALGVHSVSNGEYLADMRKEGKVTLLEKKAGRVQDVLLVDDHGNIRDSLNNDDYTPRENPDRSVTYVQVGKIPLPPLNSAVQITEAYSNLPPGMTLAKNLRAGDAGAFYFPVETNKGRWYVIVVLGSAGTMTSLLERQARQSLLYTLAVLLATTLLTAIVVWRFTRPIKYLSTAARRIALGDFSFRVPQTNRNDEMGELTDLFNEMTAKLSRTRQLETQLHEAEKAAVVGRLASAIAHEIRNPLNYINLTLDYLRTSFAPEDPERRQTFSRLAGQLKTEVARINTRISEFLNYSRPSELAMEPLDLYAICQDSLRIVEAQAAESGIETRVQKDGSLPRVLGDPEAIRSVLTNLVINGVQAIDGSGSLSIVLAPEEGGRGARIEVSDTGRGIAPEDIAKVFEPYYSTKETGTGLGLAIVKKTVDDHRGTISVKSKVGGGTTFTITLPAAGNGEIITNGTQEHSGS